jgi:hypothetical protein
VARAGGKPRILQTVRGSATSFEWTETLRNRVSVAAALGVLIRFTALSGITAMLSESGTKPT